jgi:apolipoprotein N-acyltransferase
MPARARGFSWLTWPVFACAQGATVRFYAVFGGLVLFTCLICFLKNHCGQDGDDAPKGDKGSDEP